MDNAVTLIVAALATATLVVVVFGETLRVGVLETARTLTGAGHRGMAAAAWALVMLPIWFAGLGLLIFPRLPRWLVATWLVIAAMLLAPIAPFVPGRSSEIADLVDGPGAAGFATGLRWTLWTIPALLWLLVMSERTSYAGRKGLGAAVVVATGAAALTIALIRAS
ncbi:hypothetical protein KOI35_35150 [Actinoplanes bogorensis]|uniref:Uncharacterized protein n=1 Tax=Paractinoplanes bogorensis TaxID=1610840 RepID=A0ABS5YZN9_9ACTN|nr:hypothetical protein [Actinoplanes bogorensis]MBU2668761.1 hypothetical protein [Actinoplanes bogorensis]